MLTPMDIEKKTFEAGFRGYDKKEVDEFMALILADYEKIYKENSALKDKNTALSEQVKEFKDLESAMRDTLLAAQKTGEDIKANAIEKANNIVNEAELRAKRAIADANEAIAVSEQKLAAVKREMDSYKIKTISTLKAQIELLDTIDTTVSESLAKPLEQPSVGKDFKIDFSKRSVDFSIEEDNE